MVPDHGDFRMRHSFAISISSSLPVDLTARGALVIANVMGPTGSEPM